MNNTLKGRFSPLSLTTWNARSIKNKREELTQFLTDYDIDILLLQETFLKTTDKFRIPKYKTYRTDRTTGQGGGTAIIIKTTLNFDILPTPNTDQIEATHGILTLPNNTKFNIISAYKPPNKIITENDIKTLIPDHGKTILAGDLNCKHTYWNSTHCDAEGENLLEIALDEDILIHGPIEHTYHSDNDTFRSNVLDICLTRNITQQVTTETLNELSSDHLPVRIIIDHQFIHEDPVLQIKFINWPHYNHILENNNTEYNNITNTDDLEQTITKLTHEISNAIETATVTKQNHKNKNQNLPDHIRQLIRLKNSKLRRARKTRDPDIKREANRLTQTIKDEIRDFRNDKWKDKLTEITTNFNKIHKLCKSLKLKEDITIPPLQGPNGLAITTPQKAEAFADALEIQLQNNQTSNVHWDHHVKDAVTQILNTNNDDNIEQTDDEEILTIIKSLGNKKAPGPDKITAQCLKSLPQTHIHHITNITNAILKLQYYPAQWKLAHIFVIPKPQKSKKLPQNYRPISLLSTLAKVTERIITRRITTFTETNNILPDAQFGYRSKHSTSLQTAKVSQIITNALNKRKHTAMMIFDIEKAFDRVWHDGLIYKLRQLQYPIAMIKLIHSFITNRTFQIKLQSHLSTTRHSKAGVPQGSPLSPLIYIIYTSDIPKPNSATTHLSIYADDTAIIQTSKSIPFLTSRLKSTYKTTQEWLKKWKIKTNDAKTQLICISRKRTRPTTPLTIDNQRIEWKPKIKYLGVTFDKRLTWKEHITDKRNIAIGTYKRLYPILKAQNSLSIRNKTLIYKSYIQPILTYSSTTWGNASNSQIQRLQTIQNKILRTITNAPWFVRNSIIHRDLDCPTIKDIINKDKEKLQKIASIHPNPTINDTFDYDPTNTDKTYKNILTVRT